MPDGASRRGLGVDRMAKSGKSGGSHLPGLSAVASLKPLEHRAPRAERRDRGLHGLRAVTGLKPVERRAPRAERREFARPPSRGLIKTKTLSREPRAEGGLHSLRVKASMEEP